jgi:hypothetical protein
MAAPASDNKHAKSNRLLSTEGGNVTSFVLHVFCSAVYRRSAERDVGATHKGLQGCMTFH